MKPVPLLTPRLLLSVPVASDQDRMFEYCQDPLFERFLTVPWPYTRAHAEYFVEKLAPESWASDTEYTWAVRLRNADSTSEDADAYEGSALLNAEAHDGRGASVGALIGMVALRRDHRSIGFWIGGEHRGRGYVPEAVTAVAEWGFARGFESIVWECVVGNFASASVARSLGFEFTGERESTDPYRDGRHVPSWHGELFPANLGAPQPGWPASTSTDNSTQSPGR
jgi:RimJ/RimL family protein N-acetyltransferase